MEEKRKGQGSEMRQMTSSRSNFDKERRDCITRFFYWSPTKNGKALKSGSVSLK